MHKESVQVLQYQVSDKEILHAYFDKPSYQVSRNSLHQQELQEPQKTMRQGVPDQILLQDVLSPQTNNN